MECKRGEREKALGWLLGLTQLVLRPSGSAWRQYFLVELVTSPTLNCSTTDLQADKRALVVFLNVMQVWCYLRAKAYKKPQGLIRLLLQIRVRTRLEGR
jgi:hypothetical protein